jgi:two-component system sensor histidine kinase SenX3
MAGKVNPMDAATAMIVTLFVGVAIGLLLAWFMVSGVLRNRSDSVKIYRLTPNTANEMLNILAQIGFVLDAEGKVVRASAGAALYRLVDGNHLQHEELRSIVESARHSESPVSAEVALDLGQQEPVQMVARAASFGADYVVLSLEDRTDLRRLEEVRRDFVANVSHELKTPIGAIDLLTRSIRRNSDDANKVNGYAADLAKQAERLAMMVHDIIELSRLQAAKSVSVEESTDIASAIEEAIERNAVLAETKQVKIATDLSSRHLIYGDHEQLSIAFRNLIENAINYSDAGQTVGVGIKSDGQWCTVSVKDEGVGISTEDQKRVFERFYRVDPSRSRDTGGTGLGLSIVKHIAENHHGRVEVASNLGRGSTFSIILPCAQSQTDGASKS